MLKFLIQFFISIKNIFYTFLLEFGLSKNIYILKFYRKYLLIQRKFYKFILFNLRKNSQQDFIFYKGEKNLLFIKLCVLILLLCVLIFYIYFGYCCYLDITGRYTK
jgi:hypothetical protein|nr:hypothetical protein [Actinophrys sol]